MTQTVGDNIVIVSVCNNLSFNYQKNYQKTSIKEIRSVSYEDKILYKFFTFFKDITNNNLSCSIVL